MPRQIEKTKCRSNTNKMMTRAAAAAAAATTSTSADTATEEAATRPSTSACGASASTSSVSDQCPPRPDPSSSPAKCAICLGDLSNRCYTNSCIHQFCFGCLLEWSKIKAECPLCKSNFQSIYHNIRNNDDYDEYHIPQPASIVPHLSIRLTTEGFRAQLPSFRYDDPMPQTHALQVGVMGHPPSPFHDHGYSFQRMVRERERERRQHQNNSYIRILEMGPFSEPRAIDFMNYSSGTPGRSVLDNPFYTEEPELFGSVDDNANTIATDSSLRGYQNRKRIYDRLQFVQPFAATLPAGTVFFPSVEYFQTHPSALPRISAWLYREIMALMGIHRSRNEMGYVFDVILSLLPRYDIRSRDFREMINSHLGMKTRHFQHEFYHFLISGMVVEEYDRVAHYTNPSSNSTFATSATATSGDSTSSTAPRSHRSTNTTMTSTSSTTSSADADSITISTARFGTPAQGSPIVVTIDSSDTDSDSDGIEALEPEGNSNNIAQRRPRTTRRMPDLRSSSNANPTDRLVPEAPTLLAGPSSPSPPPCRLNLHHNFFRNQHQSARADQFRQAYESHLTERGLRINTVSGHRTSTISRPVESPTSSGRRFPWDQARQPPAAHSNAVSLSMFDAGRASQLDDWESALESLNRFRPQPPLDISTSRLEQPIDGHRYTSQTRRDPVLQQVSDQPATDAIRTMDFDRPRCPVETGYPISSTFADPSAPRPERYSCAARRHNQLMYMIGADNQIPLDVLSPTISGRPGPGPSVEHFSNYSDSAVTNASSDGLSRRNAGFNFDPSTSVLNSNSSNHVSEVLKKIKKSRINTPPPPAPVLPAADDDEIELLGVHPVIKPPPLAVITLSSDDDEKTNNSKPAKVEKSEISVTLNAVQPPQPGSSNATITTIDFGGADSSDVIFESEQNGNCRNSSSPENLRPCGLFGGIRGNYNMLKRRKLTKNKKVKYTTPEFVDMSDSDSSSSSSSSDSAEMFVESLVDHKMKLKRKKGIMRSEASAGKQKRCHHRRQKKSATERFPTTLTRHKTISSCNLLGTESSVGFGKNNFVSKKRKSLLSNSDSDWEQPKRRRKPHRCEDSDSDFHTEASPKTGVFSSLASPSAFSDFTTCISASTVAAASMPSTMPGIGILDLRKLIDEKKQGKRNVGSSLRLTRSSTVVRPSQVTLPRWESGASEAEEQSSVNETKTKTSIGNGSDSDWVTTQRSVTKPMSESSSSSSDEDKNPNVLDSDDDDSSSSDTQFNSKDNHRSVGFGSSRGSFFVPNHPQPQARCAPTSQAFTLETNLPLGSNTRNMDLRHAMTQNSDPILPWRQDPIVGHFEGDGSADLLDLSLGSLQAQTPPLEADLSRSSSRRQSVDDCIDNGRAQASDWFGDNDSSLKWFQPPP